MTFREFINLDRTDESVLSDEKFRALLTVGDVVRPNYRCAINPLGANRPIAGDDP